MTGYEGFSYELFSREERQGAAEKPLALPPAHTPPRVFVTRLLGGVSVRVPGAEDALLGAEDALLGADEARMTPFSSEALTSGVRVPDADGRCERAIYQEDGREAMALSLTDSLAGFTLRVVCEVLGLRLPCELMPRAFLRRYPLYLLVTGRAARTLPAISCYIDGKPPLRRDERRLAARSAPRKLQTGKLFIALSMKGCEDAEYLRVYTDDEGGACQSRLLRLTA